MFSWVNADNWWINLIPHQFQTGVTRLNGIVQFSQSGPKVDLQLFHYFFNVLDLPSPKCSFSKMEHFPIMLRQQGTNLMKPLNTAGSEEWGNIE